MSIYDLIIIGGGASGMLCTIKAKKNGIKNILVIEKKFLSRWSTESRKL